MAKKIKKKGFKWFFLGLAIYAVVFLGLAYWGLTELWDFIEAYELTQPKYTISQHVEQLTKEVIAAGDPQLVAQIDHNIQSEEACKKYIADSLTEDITYAQNMSETTDTKLVYMLLCGSKAIGKVALEPDTTDKYGFVNWKVTEQSFDFSYLIGSEVSITVPRDFTVCANGIALNSSYITQDKVHYEALESYYADYKPPYMVTYTVAPILGEIQLTTQDATGQDIAVGEETDYSVYMNNCSESEQEAVNTLLNAFLKRYVAYTSNYGGQENTENNYFALLDYLVPGGEMAGRMYRALDGQSWAKNTRSSITDVQLHHMVNLGGGNYLCDVTYTIESKLYWEDPISVTNAKIIIIKHNGELLVESLMVY